MTGAEYRVLFEGRDYLAGTGLRIKAPQDALPLL